MMYTNKELTAWLDISTFCNAACPQCHRTDTKNNLNKVDWLPLTQWSIEDFKKIFPRDQMQHYRNFDICGTWGDPGMCKDLDKIIQYILHDDPMTSSPITTKWMHNRHTKFVMLHTNGSMRDEDFWWKLGQTNGKNLRIYFTLDGIDQEMHSKYRRKTDLQKTLDHMSAAAEGGADVCTFTVVFKHNEDYIDEILELAKQHGATGHTVIQSNRFYFDTQYEFNNEDGQVEYLEESTRDKKDDVFNQKIPIRNSEWRRKVGLL